MLACSEQCNSIPERLRTLHNNYEVMLSQIDEAFADYARALDEVKENILKILLQCRDDTESSLNEMSDKGDIVTSRISDAIKYIFYVVLEKFY